MGDSKRVGMETVKREAPRDRAEQRVDYNEPWHLTVLLVDDSEMDRSWLARQLAGSEEFQATIVEAESVAQASQLMRVHDFHLTVVDYRLPDGLGDLVVADLARVRPGCATILISSQPMAEVSLYGLRAGANAALSKDDINPGLLETTIRFALFNQAQRRVG